jgi:NADH-quinone oxidoreductase subunit H
MIITIILAAVVLITVMNFAALHTWIERKQSALMQDRIGANRAHIILPWKWAKPINFLLKPINELGLFHPIADAIKMFTKEDFIPPKGDHFLHRLAPFLSLVFAFLGFAAIPFGDKLVLWTGEAVNLQVTSANIGILYIFAMASMGVYGVILAGFSSNNNYAFLGGLRATSQMLAYEITLGLTILGIVMIYGSVDLQEITRAQGDLIFGFIPKWGIVVQPIGFFLFLAAGVAETKRVPYDMPEAESEIIGYFTEYSGMKFGMFYFADFIETILIASLTTVLFLGGWQIPYLMADGFHFPWGSIVELPQFVVCFLQISSFCAKVIFFCWILMAVRWTLPRFRYDQLMELGWKGIFPIALVHLILTAGVLLVMGW